MSKGYAFLAQYFMDRPWAMMPDAFEASLRFLRGEIALSPDMVSLFHHGHDTVEARTSELFGSRVNNSLYSTIRGDTGYLFLSGPFMPRGAGVVSEISGMTALDRATTELEHFESVDQIKQIGAVFDTPGGEVTGTPDFAARLRSSSKPVHAFAWLAGSAGYWAACGAQSITLAPTGIAGSIGTMARATVKKSDKKDASAKDLIFISTNSPKKNVDPDTPEGAEAILEMLNALSDVFVDDVAKYRGVARDVVLKEFGQGGTFVGSHARSRGMVDEVMTASEWSGALESQGLNRGGKVIFDMAKETGNHASGVSEVLLPSPVQPQAAAGPVATPPQGESGEAAIARLREIEGIKTQFAAGLPAVYQAVCATVDKLKFAPGATLQSVQAAVLTVVAEGQVNAYEQYAAPRHKAGVTAGISVGTGDEVVQPAPGAEAAEEKQQLDALVAARTRHMAVLVHERVTGGE